MDINKDLKKIFSEVLDIDENMITNDLEYNSIPEWDSISHMSLVAAVEEKFDIMMEAEDVVNMSTFEKAIEILKKYGV